MASPILAAMPPALRRRLLQDIAEVQQLPYPNIRFFVNEEDITHSCVVLTPPEQNPIHLEIRFSESYPLDPPVVTIQTHVDHPNIYGDYICASILNTEEGWTPAYTLKGVLIQLLSFFSSDVIEQEYWGEVDLAHFRSGSRWNRQAGRGYYPSVWSYECYYCGFGSSSTVPEDKTKTITRTERSTATTQRSKISDLPDEVILHLLSVLDTPELVSLSDAIPTIGRMVVSYDIIRIRELQCFCLKKSHLTTKLGIGVAITGGRNPIFRSEFDLLSNEAYNLFEIRESIHGVKFEKWLPLPLSQRHWRLVRQNAHHALEGLRTAANMREKSKAAVLYHFMNTIVVQFSNDVNKSSKRPDKRSTLSHASEKAVESYFALFHLLLCVATEDASMIADANRMVARFLAGPRSKSQFPNLGLLLVAALISDTGLTQELTHHIIKEAILRNVVWMLDPKGATMSELAYLEPSVVSEYRLHMTFEGSRTSYRLLMFLKLFSSTARTPGKPLTQLRDELFETHSAPPSGVSAFMTHKIREIHAIDSFPRFLATMGIRQIPSKQEFTSFLRRTIGDSVKAGYSRVPMTQSQLYMIRRKWEPTVEMTKQVELTEELQRWYDKGEKWFENGWDGRPSFFPGNSKVNVGGRDRRR